jgi:hypothetical protein
MGPLLGEAASLLIAEFVTIEDPRLSGQPWFHRLGPQLVYEQLTAYMFMPTTLQAWLFP